MNYSYFKKMSLLAVLQLLGFFFCLTLNAQNPNIVISWDKTGCQEDSGSSINLDSIPENACLKVCKNKVVTYVLSGSGIDYISEVTWIAEGGEPLTRDGLTAPVYWTSSGTGSLKIHITFKDETSIEKTICITKDEPVLILGWDRLGCQSNKDHVSEIRFSYNLDNADCLLVCKSSDMVYGIFGEAESDIYKITWEVTGGVVLDPNSTRTKIVWGNDNNGSIHINIKLLDDTVIDHTICVYLVDSTLMLEWDNIDENPVNEIKYDSSPDDSNTILMYPDSVSIYTIGGSNAANISSIHWQVTGGYAYNSEALSTPITWYEAELNELRIFITFNDNTTTERKINIANMYRPDPSGNPLSYNTLAFDYDTAGNQKRRRFIYVGTSKQGYENPINSYKKSISSKKTTPSFLTSEEYPELQYFPNPVKNELSVKWSNLDDSVDFIEIYSLSGILLGKYSDLRSEDSAKLEFDTYPSGYYAVVLKYSSGESKTLNIIKK